MPGGRSGSTTNYYGEGPGSTYADSPGVFTESVESVDYSLPKQQPLEPQIQVQNNNQQSSDSDETNNSTPESATDS